MKIERRSFRLELRTDEDDGKLKGHAAVFNQLSEPLWGFREKIAPGAFAETIKADDIRALFNHDSNLVLGRNTAGTLSLEEDKRGLLVEIDLPDTQFARDLRKTIHRGDVDQMSFGFNVIDDSLETIDEEVIRTLKTVALFDVSPVTFPAYPQTDVAVRSFLDRFGLEVPKVENLTDVPDEIVKSFRDALRAIAGGVPEPVLNHRMERLRRELEAMA